jgi:predicted transcriptional regulator
MARKKQDDQLTPLELEIMKVLWHEQEASVARVVERLGAERGLAYNTVQTMLTVLHRKGKVERELKDRAYVYRPAITYEEAASQAVSNFLGRMFAGRPEDLVMTMVKMKKLTREKLAELNKLVDSMDREGGDE